MVKKIILSVLLCTVCMFTMAQSQTVTHVVQRGETIESIAQYYNVSVEDINKANPNADGVVYVGMKLNIPTSSDFSKTTPKEAPKNMAPIQKQVTENHTENYVKHNDTQNNDEKVGKFEFAGELGFGFIKGADNFMYEATVGANYRLPYNIYVGARIGYNSANYIGLTNRVSSSLFLKTSWKHPC